MASDVTATTHKQRKPLKKLSHIEVRVAKNGGHAVKHIFTHYEHPSEEHAFGASEGPKLLAHLQQHLNIAPGDEGAGSEEAQNQSEKEEATV